MNDKVKMKASEELRIWIGDTKPEKEVKMWMRRLDRMEEKTIRLIDNIERLEEDLYHAKFMHQKKLERKDIVDYLRECTPEKIANIIYSTSKSLSDNKEIIELLAEFYLENETETEELCLE